MSRTPGLLSRLPPRAELRSQGEPAARADFEAFTLAEARGRKRAEFSTRGVGIEETALALAHLRETVDVLGEVLARELMLDAPSKLSVQCVVECAMGELGDLVEGYSLARSAKR